MQIIYIADIDEDVYEISGLLQALDATVELATDCKVTRSRAETDEEVCENGEWEEDEDE